MIFTLFIIILTEILADILSENSREFYTQLSCSLSEERTIYFSREQNYTANQNLKYEDVEDVEENDTSNQKPQRT